MIYIRNEGERIRNGFNFYPLSDTASFGFEFKLGRFKQMVRYSTALKEWIICYTTQKGSSDFEINTMFQLAQLEYDMNLIKNILKRNELTLQ